MIIPATVGGGGPRTLAWRELSKTALHPRGCQGAGCADCDFHGF